MSDPIVAAPASPVSNPAPAASVAPAAAPAPSATISVTIEQLKQLLATSEKDIETAGSDVLHGSIAGAFSEIGAAGKAVVSTVKSISWSHVYAVVASTAALALHLFPSLLKLL